MASASDQNHYNTGGYIAFIGSMVFTILFFIYISFIHKGVDLKEVTQPDAPASETQGAPGEAPPAAPPAEGQPGAMNTDEAPWSATAAVSPAVLDHGRSVYQNACSACHGVEGKGDGPAAHNFQARDLVAGQWKLGGDSLALFQTISNGIEGTAMASFAHLPKADRWAVVHYIRSITQNRVADNNDRLMAEAASLN